MVPVLVGTLLVFNTLWPLMNKGAIFNTSAGGALFPFQK